MSTIDPYSRPLASTQNPCVSPYNPPNGQQQADGTPPPVPFPYPEDTPVPPRKVTVALTVVADLNWLAPRDLPGRVAWLHKFGILPFGEGTSKSSKRRAVNFNGSPDDWAEIGLMTSVNGTLESNDAYIADSERDGAVEYCPGLYCLKVLAYSVADVLSEIVKRTGNLPRHLEASVLVAAYKRREAIGTK